MATKKSEAFDYRAKAAELERIVEALQQPDIDIDEATKLHAAGVEITHKLETYLKHAEITVKKHLADTK